MNIIKMLKVALVLILSIHLAYFGVGKIIDTVKGGGEVPPDPGPVTVSGEGEGTSEGPTAPVDPPVTPEYRRYIDVIANSESRGDDFVYTTGDTANDGSYRSYQIETYPKHIGGKDVYNSTTEPIADSVGHRRVLSYDLAVWQTSNKDKADEAWLVFRGGDTGDPEYMEVLATTEHMNIYSKPIQGTVEIPEDAEYVYVEAHLNNMNGYLPLLTNEISITVED